MSNVVRLDDTDRRLLRTLQADGRISNAELAERCNLSQPRCVALRRSLKIDDDPSMAYEFVFGAQKHRRYSDKADKLLRESAAEVDMDKIWQEYGPKRSPKRRLPASPGQRGRPNAQRQRDAFTATLATSCGLPQVRH